MAAKCHPPVGASRTDPEYMELAPVPLHGSVARIGFRPAGTQPVSADEQRSTVIAVARAKAGDRQALRFLYIRYADNVYGAVQRIVRDHHEAEDITQLVFAKLISAIAKYEERGFPFVCWLLRLARNVALDHQRSRRPLPVAQFDATATDDAAVSDRAGSLRAALATLPPEQREVVILRHLAGLSPREIAQRTGRSESAVDGLHHRGRRALCAELTRLGAAPATTLAAAA
jgi:RNA polymerase sigma-70 factor (ECF subfamily)